MQGIRVVLDTANGAGYIVGPTVLEELGAEVIVLHNKPDGFNINEDCGALHTKDVQKAVKEYRADIGFALDGDADRLVVIDEQGEVVNGDQLLGALGLYLQQKGMLKGEGIVATVMSNQGLEDCMEENGLKMYRANVGDKYVLELMNRHGVNFGGEQSGHVIMHDYAKTGDGLVSALQTLAFVLDSGKKASEVLRPFSLYPQKLINLNVSEKKPLETITGLDALLKELDAKHIRHLIRYSGTENKLRVLLEAKESKAIKGVQETLTELLKTELNG